MNLDEIKARTEAATPGPWNWDIDWLRQGTEKEGGMIVMRVEMAGTEMNPEAQLVLLTKDADFIAHARQDVADLVAEVERLHKENKRLLERGNDFVERINKALRMLAGPSPMEQAVATNRRLLGLPPQCDLCGADEEQPQEEGAVNA